MLRFTFAADPNLPLRILALGAHSDDIEIGCGATLSQLLAARGNVEVFWTVFSSNRARGAEALDSANEMLASAASRRIEVHEFRDGYFPSQHAEIKDQFESIKREFRPDVVFTHYSRDRHQDHRCISELARNTFRNHLILEYEIPKYDGDLGNPNLYVPFDEEAAQRKAAHLMKHFGSQTDRHWFDKETFLSLMRIRGLECAAENKYAEAFYADKCVLQL